MTFLDTVNSIYSLKMYTLLDICFWLTSRKFLSDDTCAKQQGHKTGFQYLVSLPSSLCLIMSRIYKFLQLKSEAVNPYQERRGRRQGTAWEDGNPDLVNRSLATGFLVSKAGILLKL